MGAFLTMIKTFVRGLVADVRAINDHIMQLAMLSNFAVIADGRSVTELRTRLVELSDAAASVQAKADAEKRALTDDEVKAAVDFMVAQSR